MKKQKDLPPIPEGLRWIPEMLAKLVQAPGTWWHYCIDRDGLPIDRDSEEPNFLYVRLKCSPLYTGQHVPKWQVGVIVDDGDDWVYTRWRDLTVDSWREAKGIYDLLTEPKDMMPGELIALGFDC